MTNIFYSYEQLPDFGVPPGETLAETLEALKLTQADLARRTNRPTKTINEIIKGVAEITPETALQFEQVLGVPASFWLNLERNYQEICARQAENARLETQVSSAKLYPVSQLRKLGYIPANSKKPIEMVKALLNYFGVVDLAIVPKIYNSICMSFKKSSAHAINDFALYSWLRQGEIQSQLIHCAPYNKELFLQNLERIRELILLPSELGMPEMENLCSEAGVALTIVPEVKGCRSFGVARWIAPDKALIILSLRQKSDDHFWFTFFHEAAHILLHRKKNIYVDAIDGKCLTDEEREANTFSANFLIPPEAYKDILNAYKFTETVIRDFSKKIKVTPGIVLGRLQHDGHVPYNSTLNQLKKYYL